LPPARGHDEVERQGGAGFLARRDGERHQPQARDGVPPRPVVPGGRLDGLVEADAERDGARAGLTGRGGGGDEGRGGGGGGGGGARRGRARRRGGAARAPPPTRRPRR